MDINQIKLLCVGCFAQRKTDGVCTVCGYDEATVVLPPHHLRTRTILNGKYLIGRVLGEGGFGITYIGWDINLRIKIAVKEFFPAGFVSRESATTSTVHPFTGNKGDFFLKGREKFIEEAVSLAKFVSLPGIVSVRDFFNENSTAYIAMEYIDGYSLKAHLHQAGGKLPAAQVFEMMHPVISSLAEVHKTGLIHRDISPDNIMVSKDGVVKLLDFGAARDFTESGNKSMSIMLKPGFAPEEQYSTKGVQGPWTDVYALTATLYKCITGITPDEALDRLRSDSGFVMPGKAVPELTAAQEAAILKGMAVKKENRFQTMTDLQNALNSAKPAAYTHTTQSVENIIGFITRWFAANRKRAMIAGGGLAAVLVLVLIIIIVPTGDGSGADDGQPAFAHGQGNAPPLNPAQPPAQGSEPYTATEQQGGQQGPAIPDAAYGARAVEAFLSDFTTLFLGWEETNRYWFNSLGIEYTGDRWAVLESPEFIEATHEFDWGNERSFDGFHVASGFNLWDIDGNGIPLIGISFNQVFISAEDTIHFFRYVDGSYRHVGAFDALSMFEDGTSYSEPNFYIDESGNIFARTGFCLATFRSNVSAFVFTDTGFVRGTTELTELPGEGMTRVSRMGPLVAQLQLNLVPVARERLAEAEAQLATVLAQQAEARTALHPARSALIEHLEAARQREGDMGWMPDEISWGVFYNDAYAFVLSDIPAGGFFVTFFFNNGNNQFVRCNDFYFEFIAGNRWVSRRIMAAEDTQGIFVTSSWWNDELEIYDYFNETYYNFMAAENTFELGLYGSESIFMFPGGGRVDVSRVFSVRGQNVDEMDYFNERALIQNQRFLAPRHFNTISDAITALSGPVQILDFVTVSNPFVLRID